MSENPERRDTTVLQQLFKIGEKVDDIKTNLAVNTTKTSGIEQHLKELNGKVAKHEEFYQKHTILDQNQNKREETRQDTWRRWSDKALWAIVVTIGLLFYHLLVETGIIKDFLN